MSRVIDASGAPWCPKGWKVVSHREMAQFDLSLVDFYLASEQREGEITGHELRLMIAGQAVLNASALDFLLDHLEMIPEEWLLDEFDNFRDIFFWGTVYEDEKGVLIVRYLDSLLGWDGGTASLDELWGIRSPAAVLRRV